MLSDDARFVAGKMLTYSPGGRTPEAIFPPGTDPTPRALAAIDELVEAGLAERENLEGGGFVLRARFDLSEHRDWLRAQGPGTVSFETTARRMPPPE